MPAISSPTLKFFADFIEKETGIIYSAENAYQLEGRLLQLSKTMNMNGISDLHYRSQKEGIHGALKQALVDIATNNETSFFRDPKIFSAFEKAMLPQFKSGPIRIWSCASSFGQEAYSISMLIEELNTAGKGFPEIEIFASDIAARAVERVREATYSQIEVQRGLPALHLVKYFSQMGEDRWVLKPEIRQRVRAERVNLLDISGIKEPFHIIFCRNVLIYQNEDKKKEIVEKISEYLIPGGYLVLGAAESLIGVSEAFEQIAYEGSIFYKKK